MEFCQGAPVGATNEVKGPVRAIDSESVFHEDGRPAAAINGRPLEP